jgi:hypothetical protein
MVSQSSKGGIEMISDLSLSGLKSWIQANASTNPLVSGWTIALPGEDADKVFPRLELVSTGAQEHPVLRGVMAPLSVSCILTTVPHADGSSADSDTEAEHIAQAATLYSIIADRDAVSYIDQLGTIYCYDIRGSQPTTEEEAGRRASTIEIQMTCAQR